MAEQTVGYVELEWRCPSCGNRNPGSVKKCAQCGAALTEEVQFEQAPQETIIADEAKIAAARRAPTSNAATAAPPIRPRPRSASNAAPIWLRVRHAQPARCLAASEISRPHR